MVLIPHEVRGGVRSAAHRKVVADRQVDIVRIVVIHVDPDRHRARHGRRRCAIDRQPVEGRASRIHEGRTDAVLIAYSDRLGAVLKTGARRREDVVRIVRGIIVIGDEIAPEHCVPGALQPIGSANVLIFIVRIRYGVIDLPAGVGRHRNNFQQG